MNRRTALVSFALACAVSQTAFGISYTFTNVGFQYKGYNNSRAPGSLLSNGYVNGMSSNGHIYFAPLANRLLYMDSPTASPTLTDGVTVQGVSGTGLVTAFTFGVSARASAINGATGGVTYTQANLLPTDYNANAISVAVGANLSGSIVGRYNNTSGVQRGFIYNPATGSRTAIPLAAGTTTNSALAISDNGRWVVGQNNLAGRQVAFVHDTTSGTTTVPGTGGYSGGLQAFLFSVNDSATAVGYGQTGGSGYKSIIVKNGIFGEIPALAADASQVGRDINNAGMAVGNSRVGNYDHAFRYDSNSGMISDLNLAAITGGDYVPYDPVTGLGWELNMATGVSDDGTIFGTATYLEPDVNGNPVPHYATPFILTPDPIHTWALAGGGTWSPNENWTQGTPDGANISVTFGPTITANSTVTLETGRVVGSLTFDSPTRSYTLQGQPLTLDVTNGTADVSVASGSHTVAAPVIALDNTLINTAAGASVHFTGPFGAAGVTVTKTQAGTASFAGVNAATLNVNGGKVALTGTAVVKTLNIAGTTVAPTATMDVGLTALVIDYDDTVGTVLTDTKTRIIAARGTKNAHGVYAWDGAGITSAAIPNLAAGYNRFAVAAIDNADLDAFNGTGSSYSLFGGVSVDATSVLVRMTYAGDANLDGTINAADYSLINRGFAGAIANVGWLSGDFTLDGVINADDFAVIDFGYLSQGGALGIAPPVAVPEPASVCSVAVALISTLCRRRRKETA